MKNTLVMLAHGSTDPAWQAPFQTLETQLQERLGDHVRLAYMELCSPLLEEVVEDVAHQAGNTPHRVDVLPLFFAAGRHLRQDVPAQLEALNAQFPHVAIELLPPVGQHPAFVNVVTDIVAERDDMSA